MSDVEEIGEIIQNWSASTADEKGKVVTALYDELRQNAAAHLRNERVLELQPTALVHEAYTRLVNITRLDLANRSHFLGLAGRIMREVLIDEARRKRSMKRNEALQTRFTGEYLGSNIPLPDLLELHELLNELEEVDPVYVRLFESRAFAGMTIAETAESLNISESTVKRKWKLALAWLKVRLDEQSTRAGVADD